MHFAESVKSVNGCEPSHILPNANRDVSPGGSDLCVSHVPALLVSLCWLQWVITELACYTFSMALVPLYDTLGLEAMVHILNLGE